MRQDRILVPEDSTWKQLWEFPNYWINQYGQVFNMVSGIILREFSNRWYDTYVTLRRHNKAYSRKVVTLYRQAYPDSFT